MCDRCEDGLHVHNAQGQDRIALRGLVRAAVQKAFRDEPGLSEQVEFIIGWGNPEYRPSGYYPSTKPGEKAGIIIRCEDFAFSWTPEVVGYLLYMYVEQHKTHIGKS